MLKIKHLGIAGEEAVATYLCRKGYTILHRNFTARTGEIDVIARKKDVIAFVEVKTRRQAYFPVSTVVVRSKQQKIIKTAKLFIAGQELFDKVYRFDVATVLFEEELCRIDYIKDAFQE